MTTATRHIETDALTGLRDELMRAADRRASRRRPARRTAIVIAILVGLLAATAATAALIDFTTGVPEVDELIGIEKPPGHHPAAGDATEPLLVTMGDGTYRVVAYLARDGSVCIVSAERHRESVRGSYGGCPPLEDVLRQTERRGGAWFGSSHGENERTYQLLVAGGVESIRALGKGDWKVLMTQPWTPEAPGARPLRLVVAIDGADLEIEGTDLPPEAFRMPRLELTYRDGRTRVLEFR